MNSPSKIIVLDTKIKRDEEMKERPDPNYKKEMGDLRQDPTQLSCQLVRRKSLGNFLLQKSNNERKLLQM